MSVCAVCTSANARKLTCVDSKCKIWDTSEDFKVRRTFSGHSEGVRSVQFSNTGEQFLSSGFDRFIRLWDVETGSAAATFSNRKMANCVKFYLCQMQIQIRRMCKLRVILKVRRENLSPLLSKNTIHSTAAGHRPLTLLSHLLCSGGYR